MIIIFEEVLVILCLELRYNYHFSHDNVSLKG
jgi:hypothetical protein